MVASFSTILLLAALSVANADIKASDYVYWKKQDISAWHQYFPSRALQEENMTNIYATSAAQNVVQGLKESLRGLVRYQEQELSTAQLMMEGTSAQGCVGGISTFISKAIDNEISTYQDCAADVPSRLQRAAANLTKTRSYYQSAYEAALAGIDTCAKTYPNKDSLSRLRNCVESWNKNYFTVANATKRLNSLSSPSMRIFLTAAECAETAARNLVEKGWQFLKKLTYCAKLSENIDAQTYEEEVSTGFSQYLTENDLIAQIQQGQNLNRQIVDEIEKEMLFYYDLQKRALETYVIESRNPGYYYSQVVGFLSGYYSAVSTASSDNPGSYQCISAADSALSEVANTGSYVASECDRNIVNDTKRLLAKVNDEFFGVNYVLPSVGNVALLSCFSQGYIFAEKTIIGCYNITSSGSYVGYSEVHDSVVKDVNTLLGYQNNFFGSSSLPCGDSILRRAYWGAAKALHYLERCLYINSGTKYAVTRPAGLLA